MEGSAPGSGPSPRVVSWTGALESGRSASASTGAALESMATSAGPQDPATVIYTSGTSGRMKGVLLTHGNLLASAVSSARRIGLTPDDVYLSFLPLSHVLERVVQLSMIWAGASIHFGEGLDRLEHDLQRARPTVIVGVPRLFEKVLRKAEQRAERLGPWERTRS